MTLPGPVFNANILIQGGNHVVELYDTEPAGLLCIVVNTSTSARYLRVFSANELHTAKVTKNKADYFRLIDSLYFVLNGIKEPQIHSSLDGMRPPEPFATAAAAEQYLNNVQAGSEKFTQVLSRGLIMLCKDKPMGLQAITRLGKWLLENNPNQPKVDIPK